MADEYYKVCESLNKRVRETAVKVPPDIASGITEIRLRAGLPIMATTSEGNMFLHNDGSLSHSKENSFICDRFDLLETFKIVCEYSVHSYQNEINQGFITMRGGHRVGLCGCAVVEDRAIKNIKNITSLNFRVAKSIRGAADKIIDEFISCGIQNSVIIGAPSSGKTTVLRDLARQIADGFNQTKVAVVDERGELSAMYGGTQLFDLGQSTDCLFAYPKALGIEIAIRSLSPEVIVFDEIGSAAELNASADGFSAGAAIITSVHANDAKDFCSRKIGKMLLDSEAFNKFFFLEGSKNPGKISRILSREELKVEAGGNCSDRHSSNVFGF
jgi:stage III sporulation protein AA